MTARQSSSRQTRSSSALLRRPAGRLPRPHHYPSAACGARGVSKDSPFLLSIRDKRYGARMYSIKSYDDAVICNGYGGCFIDGTHTSNIGYRNASYTYYHLGHFGCRTTPRTGSSA